ncbi:MAG: hypothetical protein FJW98_01420 [Actinobacteria bacterium]|nr:hypothetical protein [Actinomycetota bacterium]
MGTFHDGVDLSGITLGYHTASCAVTETGSYFGSNVVVVATFLGATLGSALGVVVVGTFGFAAVATTGLVHVDTLPVARTAPTVTE